MGRERNASALAWVPIIGDADVTPDVQLAPHVDKEALIGDDEDPFFVTMKVLEMGAASVNRPDLPWTKTGVQAIEQQINTRTVTGIEGHADEWSMDFDLPVVHWLGAMIDGADLYAKGYVSAHADELREYLRIAAAAGQRVGTSVDITFERPDYADVWLLSLDFVHPDWAALREAAVVPTISKDKQTKEAQAKEGEKDMAENSVPAQEDNAMALIRELFDERPETAADVVRLVNSMRQERDSLKQERDGMKQAIDKIGEAMGVEAGTEASDPVTLQAGILALQQELATYRDKADQLDVQEHIKESANGNEVVEDLLEQLVMKPDGSGLTVTDKDTARKRVTDALQTKAFKALTNGRMQMQSKHGPSVGVPPPAAQQSGRHKVERTKEEREAIAAGRAWGQTGG